MSAICDLPKWSATRFHASSAATSSSRRLNIDKNLDYTCFTDSFLYFCNDYIKHVT